MGLYMVYKDWLIYFKALVFKRGCFLFTYLIIRSHLSFPVLYAERKNPQLREEIESWSDTLF
ncbi:hypothetical protein D6B99_01355 [Arachidicoccus soli]|uniref:Uncharacterized protein n=1 Tax=Arachidicoccus soli TaxID=2341117 RepID=A0A386HLI8_9BACT|nr:hypothetical protein D6B99_01355 [Arachidicoccus soli]